MNLGIDAYFDNIGFIVINYDYMKVVKAVKLVRMVNLLTIVIPTCMLVTTAMHQTLHLQLKLLR